VACLRRTDQRVSSNPTVRQAPPFVQQNLRTTDFRAHQAGKQILIATERHVQIEIDRVIEYVCPDLKQHSCDIWADVFLNNKGPEAGSISVLHRGSLSATDVTNSSWSPEALAGNATLSSLTRRIINLHNATEPIVLSQPGVATIGHHKYTVWNSGKEGLQRIAGGSSLIDVPFTKWQIGPFAANERSLIRIHFQLMPPSYVAQVGKAGTFYAYGEAILLDIIEHEDLPCYEGCDASEFYRAFETFQAARHLVPETFEYLVISADDDNLTWETTPLSPMLYSPPIQSEALARTTHWFIADHAHGDRWSLVGTRYNGFVLKVRATEVAAQRWSTTVAV